MRPHTARMHDLAPAALVLGALVVLGRMALAAEAYNPAIKPEDFTAKITNPYFAMPAGKTMVYEAKTRAGLERTEIGITGETKRIMGVETLVIRDRVWLNGQLHEDTKDYVAQDKDGNVWYFGENVDNYEKGKLKDHEGAWQAGVKGAQPGLWMKAENKVGDSYRQEYYKGHAEDWAEVVAIGEAVTTKARSFENCTKIYEWTPLESDSTELKYYCPEAAGMVLIEDMQTGDRIELIKIETTR